MTDVARWIDEGAQTARRKDAAARQRIRDEVAELARAFPGPA